jgi:hypothetical protein
MGLFANIRRWAYQRSLDRLQATTKRQEQAMNLDRAQTIAILFDANQLDEREQVIRYAEQLRKRNKRVRLLGFLDLTDKEATYPFHAFSRKEVDWARRPRGAEVEDFLNHNYDLFFCLHATSNPVFEYLAVGVKAALKIGPVAQYPASYDLMIDLGEQASPRQLIEQAEAILKKTNVEPLTV